MAAYAALGVIAFFAVHGQVLWVVLILLGYFAVRTVIADRIRLQSEREQRDRDESSRIEAPQPDSSSELERG
jgi:hypothetical protein